jgi:hypothetical protein
VIGPPITIVASGRRLDAATLHGQFADWNPRVVCGAPTEAVAAQDLGAGEDSAPMSGATPADHIDT